MFTSEANLKDVAHIHESMYFLLNVGWYESSRHVSLEGMPLLDHHFWRCLKVFFPTIKQAKARTKLEKIYLQSISFGESVAGGNRKMFRVSRVVAHFFISLFFVWSKTFRLLFGLLLQKRVCFFWKVRKFKCRPDECPWFSRFARSFLEFRDTSQNSLWFCTGKTVTWKYISSTRVKQEVFNS